MTHFYMEYNPYTKNYVFKVEGNLKVSGRLAGKNGQRLQAILEPTKDNWDGMAKEIQKACNDTKIKVVFRGRRIDFDDLEFYLKDSEVAKFELELQETRNDSDVISELDVLFDEIKKSGISEFMEKDENGRTIFDAYQEVKNNIFDINVIATMSSGKSTLINAMLGTELLPAKNEACTATIARILDNDNMEGQGYRAICYAKDGKRIVHPRKFVTSEDLKMYNEDENVTYIDLEGEIPAIPSNRIQLRLCDTPGPNNSRNENHGRLTNSIIRETNAMVLYVMNATNFAVKDDKDLLSDISREMKRSGKESRDRFIFVINKCDALDDEKGETVEDLLEKVRDYLKGFNIADPILVPASARMALLIRKRRNGERLTRNEIKDLALENFFVDDENLHYENYASLSPAARQKVKEKIQKYHKDEDTWDREVEIHSGVGVLEEIISEYLEKYAYPMKISDAIQDIMAILKHINMNTAFRNRIKASEAEREKVLKQIEEAKRRQSESQQIVREYVSKIDRFGLDLSSEQNWKKQTMKSLDNLTKEYDNIGKVDKAEADRMIAAFVEKLQELEKNCGTSLVSFLDAEVYGVGEDMLNEYKQVVGSIFDGIEISGYDFHMDRSFNRIKIDNLDVIKRRNTSDRTEEQPRWKPNPERSGFWGFFKFWEPKEIKYYVNVPVGVDVDVNGVIVDVLMPFRRGITENIGSMFEQAQNQLSEYKDVFRENIQRLNEEIERILDEMKENVKNRDKLEAIVEADKAKAAFAEKKEKQLEAVIHF